MCSVATGCPSALSPVDGGGPGWDTGHHSLTVPSIACSSHVPGELPRAHPGEETSDQLVSTWHPFPCLLSPSPHISKVGRGWALLAPGAVALMACEEGPQHCVRPTCRARRAAKEAKEAPAQPAPEKVKVEVKKFVKIGRPGYKGNCRCPGWAVPHPPPASPVASASIRGFLP